MSSITFPSARPNPNTIYLAPPTQQSGQATQQQKTTAAQANPIPVPRLPIQVSADSKTARPGLLSGDAQIQSTIYRFPPGTTLESLTKGQVDPLFNARPAVAPANESAPPALFAQAGVAYGSRPAAEAGISTVGIEEPFIAGILPTRPEVKQLVEGGAANAFNPAWQQLVAEAVAQNGGLGNAQDGYLAYSKEHGSFVRLNNPNLTPEQNRRFAEISLTMGASVEKLPSRSKESSVDKPNVDRWANEFIESYDTQIAAFQADPSQGIQLKDGRLRFKMEFNQEAGGVVSYEYKKAGRLQSFFQSAMKFISPIADIASVAFPGVGTAIAQAVKFAGNAIARGKVIAGDIVGAVAGFIPGIGKGLGFAMTGAQTAATNGILGGLAGVIDGKGKTGWGGLLSSVGASLLGTGDLKFDELAKKGLGALGNAIDGKQFDVKDLLGVLQPLGEMVGKDLGLLGAGSGAASTVGGAVGAIAKGNGLPDWGNDLLSKLGIKLDADDVKLIKSLGKAVVKGIRGGDVSGSDIAGALQRSTPRLTSDSAAQLQINHLVATLGNSVDAGRISVEGILQAIATGLQNAASQRQQAA